MDYEDFQSKVNAWVEEEQQCERDGTGVWVFGPGEPSVWLYSRRNLLDSARELAAEHGWARDWKDEVVAADSALDCFLPLGLLKEPGASVGPGDVVTAVVQAVDRSIRFVMRVGGDRFADRWYFSLPSLRTALWEMLLMEKRCGRRWVVCRRCRRLFQATRKDAEKCPPDSMRGERGCAALDADAKRSKGGGATRKPRGRKVGKRERRKPRKGR